MNNHNKKETKLYIQRTNRWFLDGRWVGGQKKAREIKRYKLPIAKY